MTRKEQLKFDHVVAENALLRQKISKHIEVYGELSMENIELRARLETLSEVMGWPYGAEFEVSK